MPRDTERVEAVRYRAVAEIRRRARLMLVAGDSWYADVETDYCSYDYEVVPGMQLAGWVEQRKILGGSTHILELFGSAVMFGTRVLEYVDSLTGVRLLNTDDRIAEYVENEDPVRQENVLANLRFNNRDVIEGDLFAGRTWKGLERSMEARQIPGFDLIVCRPCGVFMFDPPEDMGLSEAGEVYSPIFIEGLRRSAEVLAQDGIIMSTVPDILVRTSGGEIRFIPLLTNAADYQDQLNEIGLGLALTMDRWVRVMKNR